MHLFTRCKRDSMYSIFVGGFCSAQSRRTELTMDSDDPCDVYISDKSYSDALWEVGMSRISCKPSSHCSPAKTELHINLFDTGFAKDSFVLERKQRRSKCVHRESNFNVYIEERQRSMKKFAFALI